MEYSHSINSQKYWLLMPFRRRWVKAWRLRSFRHEKPLMLQPSSGHLKDLPWLFTCLLYQSVSVLSLLSAGMKAEDSTLLGLKFRLTCICAFQRIISSNGGRISEKQAFFWDHLLDYCCCYQILNLERMLNPKEMLNPKQMRRLEQVSNPQILSDIEPLLNLKTVVNAEELLNLPKMLDIEQMWDL